MCTHSSLMESSTKVVRCYLNNLRDTLFNRSGYNGLRCELCGFNYKRIFNLFKTNLLTLSFKKF